MHSGVEGDTGICIMARQTCALTCRKCKVYLQRVGRDGQENGSGSATFPHQHKERPEREEEKWMMFHNLIPLCHAIFWVIISPAQNVTSLNFCSKIMSSIVNWILWLAGF